jgi:hypothetical protein
MSRELKRLHLSRVLSPEEVSLAWEFLAGLPTQELWELETEFEPPPPLQNLSDSDWYLLSNLLAREELLKSRSPIH